jgi:hypothetical protein
MFTLALALRLPSLPAPGNAGGSAANVLDFAALTPAALASRFGWVRTGAGTMEDSGGDLVYGAHNLLLQSENLSSAAWVVQAASVNGGQTDREGGTTAWKLTADTSTTNLHRIYQLLTVNGSFKIEVKAAGAGYARVVSDTSAVILNLATGEATLATGTNVVVSLGNGWYSVELTGLSAGTNVQVWVSASDGSPFAGNGTDGVLIWRPQQSFVSSPYVPTTTSPVFLMRTPDYSFGVPGLLLEGQRPNLLAKTEQFDDAAWTNQELTVNANVVVSPANDSTADILIPTASSNLHRIFQNGAQTGADFAAFTGCFKPSGLSKIAIRENNATGAFVSFDLSGAGVVLDQANAGSVSIHDRHIYQRADGWYVVRVVFSQSSPTSKAVAIYALPNSYTSGQINDNWVGDGTSGIAAWGAQFEPGAYPTSYIPNSGTGTVTRAADVAEIGPGAEFDSLFPAAQGTLVVEWVDLGANVTDLLTLHAGGSIAESLGIYVVSGPVIVYAAAGNVLQLGAALGTAIPLAVNRAAFSWGPAGLQACLNGAAVQSNASATIPAVTHARFAGGNLLTGVAPNWKPAKLTTLPTQTTGAALQALTV